MRASAFLSVFFLVIMLLGHAPDSMEGASGETIHECFAGKTIVVAKDGTGDHSTIQAGVDAASSGDIVRVYDGVYKESVNIGAPITLIGNGTSRSVLDGDGTLDHQHLFRVMSNNVNITGFEFREGSPHHEFAGVGIYASDVNVYRNHFYDNTNGIYVAGGPGNIIHNNTFDANYRGIRSDMGCDRNTIKDNVFTNNTSVGILYLGASHVTISKNEFIDNAYHMGLFNSHYYDIGHNLFENADPGRSGLMVGTSTNNEVHNNTFIDNDVGMSLSSGGDANTIVRNLFMENSEGIRAYADVHANVIHRNSFLNNTIYGVNCSASSVTVNATHNYWGNHTGPYNPTLNPSGTGDNVSINVSFKPWLLGEFENHSPILSPIGPRFIDEDTTFALHLNASDPDDHDLHFDIWSDADWLSFNATSKNLTGTPGNLELGPYFVNITISDGWGGSVGENFTLMVNNTPPVIFTDGLPDAVEDLPYTHEIDFKEEEGAVWSFHSNAAWLHFDPEDISISGTPGNNDVGTCFVHLNISDTNGGYDDVNLSLEVQGVDDRPGIFKPLDNIQFNEDSSYLLDLSLWVLDQDDDVLEYSYAGKDELTVTFDPFERSALIVPEANWSGYDMGKFSAKSGPYYVNQTIMIEVLPVNDAPSEIVMEVPSGPLIEGDLLFLNCSAEDVDIPYGDVLHFGWYSNISGPLGNGTSLHLHLVNGTHTISLNVSDLGGAFVVVTREVEIEPFPVDDNDTEPGNDTDDDMPDDDVIDDDSTEPDDDTTDDDVIDEDVSDDDEVTEEDDGTPNQLFYLILLAAASIIILAGVLLVIIRMRGPGEEIMSWDDEE